MSEQPNRREQLVTAAIQLMLAYGYNGTSVDQICAVAGVTKGSFFHYFKSKEDVCRAALKAWADRWRWILGEAKLAEIEDPLERLMGLFDLMERVYTGDGVAGCMIGTVAQEVAPMNRDLGDPCAEHLNAWSAHVEGLLSNAKAAYPPKIDFDPKDVADFALAVVQGTFLVARTRGNRDVVLPNVRQLRSYVQCLFGTD